MCEPLTGKARRHSETGGKVSALSKAVKTPPSKRRRHSSEGEAIRWQRLCALGGTGVKWAWHIVALSDGRLVATCSQDHVRIFNVGDMRSAEFRASNRPVLALCALGGGNVVVSSWCCGRVVMHIGDRILGEATMDNGDFGTAIAQIDADHFVCATVKGDLRVYEHHNGWMLRERARVHAHSLRVCGVAAYKGVIVTASADASAAVWCVRSLCRMATLRHGAAVSCVSVRGTRIATGSMRDVRIYRNGEDYALLLVVRAPHGTPAAILRSVSLIGDTLLLSSAGGDSDIMFTCLIRERSVAKVQAAELDGVYGVAVLPDSRIAACGISTYGPCGVVIPAPTVIAARIQAHAKALFNGEEHQSVALTDYTSVKMTEESVTSECANSRTPVTYTSPTTVVERASGCSETESMEAVDGDDEMSALRRWEQAGASAETVSTLCSSDLAEMIAAYIVGYSSRRLRMFRALKCCLARYFEHSYIQGDAVVGVHRLNGKELYDGIMKAFEADKSVGVRLGLKVVVSKFLSQTACPSITLDQ